MNDAYTTDFDALGLSDHSPFDILQQIRRAPFVKPEKRTYTEAEKKQKQKERNRIFMAGARLKANANRVNDAMAPRTAAILAPRRNQMPRCVQTEADKVRMSKLTGKAIWLEVDA